MGDRDLVYFAWTPPPPPPPNSYCVYDKKKGGLWSCMCLCCVIIPLLQSFISGCTEPPKAPICSQHHPDSCWSCNPLSSILPAAITGKYIHQGPSPHVPHFNTLPPSAGCRQTGDLAGPIFLHSSNPIQALPLPDNTLACYFLHTKTTAHLLQVFS